MGWKSYDHDASDYNREEDAVGSSATAYINLGVYLRYRLSDRLGIFGGAEITHFSNGNTSDPNPGINMLGARLGISYALGAPSPLRRADWSDFEPSMMRVLTFPEITLPPLRQKIRNFIAHHSLTGYRSVFLPEWNLGCRCLL